MENKSGRAFNVILFTTAFLLFATVLAWFVFAANPSLTSIVTKDSNNDGTIDQLVVTFGSDLDNSGTFDGTGFTVGSGCTAITGGSETGAGVITLDVTCTASNTALLPTLAYNNNTGNLFEDAGTQVADYINSFGAT
ncbi:MAG TPA: hypothetical protein VK158_05025, partial [Acidobacteriota bacterium]|nr:hypothetical protein [Acidobacteriota bacterium]